jgi:glycosyltransferase involved in cell wall biosynthesis
MMKAQVFAYPTYFWETFCMTAAEQMAAGNPIVSSNLAGLSSTVGDAGVLLPGDSRSSEYKEAFTEEVIRMMTDQDRWSEYSHKSLAKAKLYSWDGIADEWLDLVGIPK